ncbi:MAG: ABC transporter permease [Chloroflexi bacterium]|nr:ABC transporter permease [Chloroflexota bacterium]
MTSAPTVQDDLDLTGIDDRSAIASAWTFTKRFVRLQPGGAIGIVIILIIGLAAAFAPYINTAGEGERGIRSVWRDDGREISGVNFVLQPPGPDWWLGTNRTGQDLWSRVVYGARPALMIGIGAVGVAIVVATSLSLAMGFLQGVVDGLLLRIIEVIIAVPGILWLILFTTALDRSIPVLIFAIAFTFSPLTTLVLRGNVIQESASTYAESARVVGASSMRIMFRHILPNLLPLAIVNASIIIPAAILAEAGLSFLGLGLDPLIPSWGADIGPNARAYFQTAWWLPVFPGLALSLTVLAFNFLGDSLRDVLDPRLRGSGLI